MGCSSLYYEQCCSFSNNAMLCKRTYCVQYKGYIQNRIISFKVNSNWNVHESKILYFANCNDDQWSCQRLRQFIFFLNKAGNTIYLHRNWRLWFRQQGVIIHCKGLHNMEPNSVSFLVNRQCSYNTQNTTKTTTVSIGTMLNGAGLIANSSPQPDTS